MVQLFLFLLSIIFSKGICDLTLKIEPHSTVLHGDRVTFTCSKNDVQLGSVKWNLGEEELAKTDNPLEMDMQLFKSTDIKCTNPALTSEFVTETLNVKDVVVKSSDDCRGVCEVSCTLYPVTEEPEETTWSWGATPEVLKKGETFSQDETSITHSLDNLKYNSLRTYLTIKNLGETKYFTCNFERSSQPGSYSLSRTLSALIRPTNECHTKTCVNKDQCHSEMVINNATCRDECQECFTYKYQEGDFINNDGEGKTCMDDKDWCVQYLDDKKKCSDIAKDKIASYCNMCGYCLAEFSSSKLILPLIILACLCLLTVLMCYKSYEEKRSVLPKVHVTNSDAGASKRQVNKGDGKFVPQVSMIKENRCASDEKFRLKVKSKGAAAPPANGAAAANNKQSASQII